MKKIVIALADAAETLKAMETDGEEMSSENIIAALTHGDMWSIDTEVEEINRINTKSIIRRISIQMTEGGI